MRCSVTDQVGYTYTLCDKIPSKALPNTRYSTRHRNTIKYNRYHMHRRKRTAGKTVQQVYLPTTKSCPLIKPADTSSCATPSGVSDQKMTIE